MGWPTPKESAGGDFIKLQVGENRIRVVQEPVERGEMHFSNKQSFPCTGQGCQYCASAVPDIKKCSNKYLFSVIDRVSGSLSLLETGAMIYGKLFELSQSSDWGFDSVPHFDMVIVKSGAGLETRYEVNPCPATELSEEDKKAIAELPNLMELVEKLNNPSETVADDNQPPIGNFDKPQGGY